jgi:hypothetical protein
MNKKLLAVAITSALAVPMAAQAVSFKISGHVNRAIMFADDGNDSDVMQVDNLASQSRLILTGSDNLGVGGMKAGVHMEWGFSSNASTNVTIKGRNGNTGGTDTAFNIRHSYLWFSGNWGKLTMGHTSAANDGSHSKGEFTPLFLANLTVAATSFGSAIAYQNAGTQTAATVGNTTASFDGGRYDVLRYDTPRFGPVGAKVSVGDNGRWAVGADLSTSFSGAKIAAGIGYEDNEQDGGFDQWAISGGVMFSQGTALAISYSERDRYANNPASTPSFAGDANNDAENFYVQLSHTWGNNTIGIDYNETDNGRAIAATNAGVAGEDATSWGIGFVHQIPGPNVQLYTGYKNYDLDSPAGGVGNTEDVDVFNIGARVRF